MKRFEEPVGKGVTKSLHVSDMQGTRWILKNAFRTDQLTGASSFRNALSEMVAIRYSERLGLTMPEHMPIELPQILVDTEPGFSGYRAGYHIGVKRLSNFVELGQVGSDTTIRARVCGSIENPAESIGVVVTDTWLANWDHARGSEGPSENPGNLLFEFTGAGTQERATMWVIDLGHAFDVQHWGTSSTRQWPQHVRGTCRLFYEEGWIPEDFASGSGQFEQWVADIEGLDLDAVLGEILDGLPQEWTATAELSPGKADWDDLIARMSQHRTALRTMLKDKYDEARQHRVSG